VGSNPATPTILQIEIFVEAMSHATAVDVVRPDVSRA
jgi:hypothetical protein